MSDWARTRRVAAEVVIRVDERLVGELHLQPVGGEGTVEQPLDLLNRPEGFLALTLKDSAVRLVSKEQVTAVAFEPAPAEAWERPLAQRHTVRVKMVDGQEFKGQIYVELPGSPRPIDFLNVAGPFFSLSAPERVWCLNRHRVLWVQPLEESLRGSA
ncbi:MAG: hypothetical protein KJP18_00575 [Gemmatimonadetes bacterium]|nr:hypothetical protein [Gemmatimonadota bacterium]NNK62819.1 hypothetical protein [Gemmatimonadota bacterium]